METLKMSPCFWIHQIMSDNSITSWKLYHLHLFYFSFCVYKYCLVSSWSFDHKFSRFTLLKASTSICVLLISIQGLEILKSSAVCGLQSVSIIFYLRILVCEYDSRFSHQLLKNWVWRTVSLRNIDVCLFVCWLVFRHVNTCWVI